MTARRIQLEHDVIEAPITRVHVTVDEIEKLLNDLERRSGALRGEWSGEAANAYDYAHRKWDAAERELDSIAKALAATAKTGNQKFRSLDAANARVWSL